MTAQGVQGKAWACHRGKRPSNTACSQIIGRRLCECRKWHEPWLWTATPEIDIPKPASVPEVRLHITAFVIPEEGWTSVDARGRGQEATAVSTSGLTAATKLRSRYKSLIIPSWESVQLGPAEGPKTWDQFPWGNTHHPPPPQTVAMGCRSQPQWVLPTYHNCLNTSPSSQSN